MDPIKIMQALRVASLADGVSYLLLMGIAMPLKYLAGIPEPVSWVGWAHGALFISLGFITLAAMIAARLSFRLACIVGIAALLPGGPFFIDGRLKRHQATLATG
jgi:integral membrane protein